ncbi:hypothetical protein WDW86_04060 [Bdellovibrionota bacterium FG-2]
MSEVLLEAFRQCAASKSLKEVRAEAKKLVKKKGPRPDDIGDMAHEGLVVFGRPPHVGRLESARAE